MAAAMIWRKCGDASRVKIPFDGGAFGRISNGDGKAVHLNRSDCPNQVLLSRTRNQRCGFVEKIDTHSSTVTTYQIKPPISLLNQ
ncbi:hypothetical protein L6452_40800 [Arctium lappa]|uniref:Uncharacterized protein n=1 Tax=Arctium lappa TaxID=4217 RepID=A0ACB8XP10_ARCLA|nr:hypothetical protein L6452_40800 [Arctium lappa]